MSFINAALALGGLTFVIPLAIHLLFRARFRTVDWGAMFLLSGAAQKNRRRTQWLQLLLLLLRCAIPLLLAFTLARPLLTGQKTSSNELPQSLLILFDDSRSMATRNRNGETRLTLAKNAAAEVLSSLTRRDEVVFLRTSQLSDLPVYGGRIDGESLLQNVEPIGGPFRVDEAIQSAVESLSRASHPQRRVVMISDFQQTNLNTTNATTLQRLAERLDSPDETTTFSFLHVADNDDAIDNVSIDVLRMDSSAAIARRPTAFVVELRNSADEPAVGIPLRWAEDGRQIISREIDIPAKGSKYVRFRGTFEEPGLHEVSVAIDLNDDLPQDNRRRLAIDALPAIDVILIDGKPSRTPLDGTADFLMLALQPQNEDKNFAAKFNVQRVSPRLIASEARSLRNAIVVLCNAPVNDRLRTVLADHVLRGGPLVIFDGDQVQPETYNESWEGRLGSLRLPFTLGDRRENTNDDDEGIPIERFDMNYSPWHLLTQSDDQPLANATVRRYREFELVAEPINNDASRGPDKHLPSAIALASSPDDAPLIAIGSPLLSDPMPNGTAIASPGRLIYFSFAPHPSDTSLPLRSSFVPMVQQMFLDMAGQREGLNNTLGQTLVVSLDDLQSESKSGSDQKEWSVQVESPNGDMLVRRETITDQSPNLLFTPTRSGRYTVRAHTESTGMKEAPQNATDANTQSPLVTWRLVEVPASESDLRVATGEQLESFASTLSGKTFTDASALTSDDRMFRFGREIWRPVCFLLLALLFGELWMLQAIGGNRGTSKRSNPPTAKQIVETARAEAAT